MLLAMSSSPPETSSSACGIRAALGVVSAEFTHEIAHTLNFLRVFVEQTPDLRLSHEEMVGFARQEVTRLRELIGHLRRIRLRMFKREPLNVHGVLAQVLASLEELRERQGMQVDMAVPQDLMLIGDDLQLSHALCLLIEHALLTAPADSTLHIRVTRGVDTRKTAWELTLKDCGPDLSNSASGVFDPWGLPGDDVHPLRFGVVHRVIRSLGWDIAYARTDDCNEFVIKIPPEDRENMS